MERVHKRGKVILIAALLAFTVLTAGCVQPGQNAQQTGQNNQTGNVTTPSAPSDQQLQPEFNDHLDEALAELEETR